MPERAAPPATPPVQPAGERARGTAGPRGRCSSRGARAVAACWLGLPRSHVAARQAGAAPGAPIHQPPAVARGPWRRAALRRPRRARICVRTSSWPPAAAQGNAPQGRCKAAPVPARNTRPASLWRRVRFGGIFEEREQSCRTPARLLRCLLRRHPARTGRHVYEFVVGQKPQRPTRWFFLATALEIIRSYLGGSVTKTVIAVAVAPSGTRKVCKAPCGKGGSMSSAGAVAQARVGEGVAAAEGDSKGVKCVHLQAPWSSKLGRCPCSQRVARAAMCLGAQRRAAMAVLRAMRDL